MEKQLSQKDREGGGGGVGGLGGGGGCEKGTGGGEGWGGEVLGKNSTGHKQLDQNHNNPGP